MKLHPSSRYAATLWENEEFVAGGTLVVGDDCTASFIPDEERLMAKPLPTATIRTDTDFAAEVVDVRPSRSPLLWLLTFADDPLEHQAPGEVPIPPKLVNPRGGT